MAQNWYDMSREDLVPYQKIDTPRKLKSVKILENWKDDGEICLTVLINDELEVEFLYLSFEFAAEVLHFKQYKASIIEYIQGHIESRLEEIEYEEEIERKEEAKFAKNRKNMDKKLKKIQKAINGWESLEKEEFIMELLRKMDAVAIDNIYAMVGGQDF